jgi:hypothetical protein
MQLTHDVRRLPFQKPRGGATCHALCSGVTVTSPRVHATAASRASASLPANCLLINQSIANQPAGRWFLAIARTTRPLALPRLTGRGTQLLPTCQIDHSREHSRRRRCRRRHHRRPSSSLHQVSTSHRSSSSFDDTVTVAGQWE